MTYREEPREWVNCAYADCTKKAIVRKQLSAHNSTALCIEHYDMQHLNAALKWNRENGLDTEEKRKAYFFKFAGKVFKPMLGRRNNG